ncbi:hypothetical protein [Erwinia aphidicola]|uniref:hypothetical protein n=1 Tax=Erwinia aphidicola TaxID=68334 RepID=UPI003D1A9A47
MSSFVIPLLKKLSAIISLLYRVIIMGGLLARLNRLERAMTPKDGDVQVISALVDELAGKPQQERMRSL